MKALETMTPPRGRLAPFCRRLAATVAAGQLAASFGLAIGWSTVANWQLQLSGEQLRLEPAQRAGLRPGDIILAINGERITSVDDVLRLTDSDRRSWRYTLDRQGRIINQFLRF